MRSIVNGPRPPVNDSTVTFNNIPYPQATDNLPYSLMTVSASLRVKIVIQTVNQGSPDSAARRCLLIPGWLGMEPVAGEKIRNKLKLWWTQVEKQTPNENKILPKKFNSETS